VATNARSSRRAVGPQPGHSHGWHLRRRGVDVLSREHIGERRLYLCRNWICAASPPRTLFPRSPIRPGVNRLRELETSSFSGKTTMDPSTEAKSQTRRSRYPAKLRDRSVGMMQEHHREYETEHQALTSIARQLGCTPRP